MIWLGGGAHAAIALESRKRRLRESGGALLGYETQGEVVILIATGPGPSAKHRRASFEPDWEYVAGKIACAHEKSLGRLRYLGSWHSHPLGAPQPSYVDWNTAREMATQAEVALLRPIILIQSTRFTKKGFALGSLKVFRWSRASQLLVELEFSMTTIREAQQILKALEPDLDGSA